MGGGAVAACDAGAPSDGGSPGCGQATVRRGKLPASRNALFEHCYRGKLVPEEEWTEFMAVLQRDLPVTFRFSTGCPLSAVLANYMEAEFLKAGVLQAMLPTSPQANGDGDDDGDRAVATPPEPLARLAWLEASWKLDIPKTILRKAAGPKRLHNFLKQCTDLGAISRQEAVSMVPPILLTYERGLRVLDMCASPGMKTLQLIDMTVESSTSGCAALEPTARSILASGAVVANELDGRRCCMLAHHVLRARSPAGLVVHHNALSLPCLGGAFDRVLCDVPCTGDGTIRKAPQLLAGWRPNRANVMHSLQLRIACAGAMRLAPGGRLVYSTCAFSPVENEAVVAALLCRAAGALELVDCSQELTALPRRQGLEHWEVVAGARHCKSPVDLKDCGEAARRGVDVPASAWPPVPSEASERVGLPANLRRCLRFYPHLGDSGGFFVAVLRRVNGRTLPPEFDRFDSQAEASGGAENGDAVPFTGTDEEEDLPQDAVCKEALPASQKEANYASVASVQRTKDLILDALAFYGLEAFPAENFFVRNEGTARNVYLVSDGVRDALNTSPDVRALLAGVRVFDENRFLKSSKCILRLCQEGLHWIGPLMRRRCCTASPEDFLRLLDGTKVNFVDLPETSKLRHALESLDAQGSVAISCSLACGARLFAAAERGAECVSLFVNQHELRDLRDAVRGYLCPG